MHHRFRRTRQTLLALVCVAISAFSAAAQDEVDDVRQELERLKDQLLEMQQVYEAQIRALEGRLEELESRPLLSEREFAADIAPPVYQSPAPAASTSFLNIGVDGLIAAGGSSLDNEGLQQLQLGAHDPNRNGFTIQQAELSLTAAVDPYFDAKVFIIFQVDADGETVVELEEAYMSTRALPGGLQLKIGQFFTEFGRHNSMHPHGWDFVDQPVVISRIMGPDSLRSQGVRLSWLPPLPWYAEFLFAAQNASGETAVSFLGEGAGEDGDGALGGHALIDRDGRGFGDLLYTARLLNGFDLSDTVSMNLGASGAWGPNSGGANTNTSIVGGDVYLKWQSVYSQRGFPFVSLQAEVISRRFTAGDPGDPLRENLKDWGLYGQAMWGFRPGWVAGLRFDYADASGGLGRAGDFLRDERKRLSPNLTWYPSEFSKLRLQYNHDWAEHIFGGNADALWLQLEFALGQHLAHTF